MWLLVCFCVAVAVFVVLAVWQIHEKMDSEYNFLRREIDSGQVDHGARLANLEMASPGFRERLDMLEKFLDVEMKVEPVESGWRKYRTVYGKIDRCKKCGGRT